MVQLAEQFSDTEETLRLSMDGRQSQMHTGQPGIIVSYDPATQTAVVQPAVQGRVQQPDGTHELVNLPLVLDVPVAFPGGGGYTLTFPVAKGDECFLVHAHRDFSAWYQQGGTQPPLETRMHDLSDAIAYVGVRSQPRKLAGASTSSAQLRSDDGATVIDLANGTVRITATLVEIAAATTHIKGALNVDGEVTTKLNGGVHLSTHTHPDAQQGNTRGPIAGS